MTVTPEITRRTAVALGGTGVIGLGLAACAAPASTPADEGDAPAPEPAETDSEGEGTTGAAGGSVVAALADVPVGGSLAVDVDGKPYIVAQPESGTVVAFTAICTHQGCKVAANKAQLDCPCHGSQFDAFTGEVLHGPAENPLAALEVTIDGENIVTA
jgi:Rieske Fe-S protein